MAYHVAFEGSDHGRELHPYPSAAGLAVVAVADESADAIGDAVLLLATADSEIVRAAAAAGLEARIVEVDDLGHAATLALQQLEELCRLRKALERQAVMERAKGILMARHAISEAKAFEMLRRHARNSNQKLFDVATAVLESHLLLAHRDGERVGELA